MVTSAQTFRKDPDSVLDYGFDWYSQELIDDPDKDPFLQSGETIDSSAWTVPTGITKDSDEFNDTVTKIWLSGGTAGENYRLTNSIVTSEGREIDRSFVILVEER